MTKFLWPLILFSITALGQTANPASTGAGGIAWPRITVNSGVPTQACNSSNYGQPYQVTGVTPNQYGTCGTDGWAIRGTSSSSLSGQTTTCAPKAASASTSTSSLPICDDGTTTTITHPLAISSTDASQASFTYNATPVVPGSSTTAVVGADSSGHAVVSAAGGSASRLCDVAGLNGTCGGGTTTNALTGAASGGASAGTTFDGSVARIFDYHTLGAQQAITLTTTGSSGPSTLSGSALNIPQYSGGGSVSSSANIYSANSQVLADSLVSTPINGYYSFGDSITATPATGATTSYPVIVAADIGAALTNDAVSGDAGGDMAWHVFTALNPSDDNNPIVTGQIGENDADNVGAGALPTFTKYQYASATWSALSSTNKIMATSGAITPTGSPSTDTTWANANGLTFTSAGTAPYTACQVGPSGVLYAWFKMVATAGSFTVNIDGTPATDTIGGSSTVQVTWSADPALHQSAAVGAARYAGISPGAHTCTFVWASGTTTFLGFGFSPVTRSRGNQAPRFYMGGVPRQQANNNQSVLTQFNAVNIAVSSQLVSDGLFVPFVDVANAMDVNLDFISSPTQNCAAGGSLPIHPNQCGQQHLAQVYEAMINSGGGGCTNNCAFTGDTTFTDNGANILNVTQTAGGSSIPVTILNPNLSGGSYITYALGKSLTNGNSMLTAWVNTSVPFGEITVYGGTAPLNFNANAHYFEGGGPVWINSGFNGSSTPSAAGCLNLGPLDQTYLDCLGGIFSMKSSASGVASVFSLWGNGGDQWINESWGSAGGGPLNGSMFWYDATANKGLLALNANTSHPYIATNASSVIGWSSDSNYAQNAVPDTAFSRDSAGVVDVGNGTAGDKTATINAANGAFGTALTVAGNNVCQSTGTNCPSVSSGFPITLGSTSIAASSTTTALAGFTTLGTATLNGATVNVSSNQQMQATGTATSSANFGSAPFNILDSYWTGSAAAGGQWTVQDLLGTGANPTSVLNFTYGGSGAFAGVGVPNLSVGARLTATSTISSTYATLNNCSSSASPAVCGAAAAGSVVIAAGSTSVTVNTTAVSANSQIILTGDDSLGTRLGVTCNSTLATALAGIGVTARTATTSFTITTLGTVAVNPMCVSYTIIN